MESNIWRFYGIAALSGFVLYYAVDMVLIASRGMSLSELALIEAVYAAGVMLLEIPLGVLADRWSRKGCVALNYAFFIASTVLWATGFKLWVFLAGSVVAAFHSALLSGSFNAIIFDSLKQSGRESNFERVLGKCMFIESLSALIASIIGGMVAAQWGLVIPFYLTIPFSLGALLLTLSLKEPEIARTTSQMGYATHIKETLRYLWERPVLFPIITVFVVITASFKIIDEFRPIYAVYVGLPVFFLGYLNAVANGIEAMGGRLAHRLVRRNHNLIYALMLSAIAIGFILAGSLASLFGVVFVLIPVAVCYAAEPLLLGDLHREVPSDRRATVESVLSLFRMLAVIPLAIAFGAFADHTSLFAACSWLGVLLVLIAGLHTYWLARSPLPVRQADTEIDREALDYAE